MKGWASVANNIWEEQKPAGGGGTSHAVVAWLGYDTPKNPFAVEGLDRAHRGGASLDRALLGTEAVNADARKNVIGFSYGGTTAGEALAHGTARVNTVAMVATPGVDDNIGSARELHADHVYEGENDVTWRGGGAFAVEERVNVHNPSFGAGEFGTRGEGELRAVTEHAAHTKQKTGYFDLGTGHSTPNGTKESSGPEEKDTTAREARDNIVAFAKDTAALIDIDGWGFAPSSVFASPCEDEEKMALAYIYRAPKRPASRDRAADVKKVAEFWESRGLSTYTSGKPGALAVYGRDGAGISTISFQTGPGLYAISGTTTCVPGVFDEYVDPGDTN